MQVELRQVLTGQLQSKEIDGVRHIKALPYFSIVQSVEGRYSVQLGDGEEVYTTPGGVFLAPAQITQTITHHAEPATGQMTARWAFLELYLDGCPAELLYSFPVVAEEPGALLNALFAAEDPCDRMSIGYQLVKWLLARGKRKEPYAEVFAPVLSLIRREYARTITVAELAQVAHLSESHFFAMFKKAFGCSPVAYLNNYRLSVASVLLKETSLPIGQIAEQVGIPDQFYFSRLFKRRYCKTPTAYKRAL
ncbi:MAG: helix-turn-helix transcriptional regulator [Clostridia bacterium]|nr:helix-turn-helix transcriptional regulator [Clostridia bacterium]